MFILRIPIDTHYNYYTAVLAYTLQLQYLIYVLKSIMHFSNIIFLRKLYFKIINS